MAEIPDAVKMMPAPADGDEAGDGLTTDELCILSGLPVPLWELALIVAAGREGGMAAAMAKYEAMDGTTSVDTNTALMWVLGFAPGEMKIEEDGDELA